MSAGGSALGSGGCYLLKRHTGGLGVASFGSFCAGLAVVVLQIILLYSFISFCGDGGSFKLV